MAADIPLDHLVLGAGSAAEDLAFVALADLSSILTERPDIEARLIGGVMVTLHAQRWQLGQELYRQTGDADLGVPPIALKDPWIVEQLGAKGYTKTEGNRFEKQVDDLPPETTVESGAPRAAIDILVPAYTSRPRDNVRVGELATTEVRGLAYALNNAPVPVSLEMTRLNGDVLKANILLPSEAACLVLRAFAWSVRGDAKDAVDLWRALEIAAAAGVKLKSSGGQDEVDAIAITRQAFDSPGTAFEPFFRVRGLRDDAATQHRTRLKALIREVLPRS
ncbi:MAG: hypothetical protein ACRD1T_08330 [Acidimicrobiia bacterium]